MLKEKFDAWYFENVYFGTGILSKVDRWFRRGWRIEAYFFIRNALNDPYKKERKTIPRFHWEDRNAVMEKFLYEIFLNYCHDEDPYWNVFDDHPYLNISEELQTKQIENFFLKFMERNRIARRVEIYDWITKGRHEYQKRLDEDFSCELEDEFFAISTKYLMMIVEIRGELWT